MITKKLLQSFVLTMLLAGVAMSALAIERIFPENVKRGKLSVTSLADLVINGKLRHTTPSTRIYNEDGLIVTSSAIANVNAVIHYTENDIGEIERVWILSAAEVKQAPPKNK